ncbi:MAG: hypothetical protein AAF821_26055 [Cyanobacteria bacterium P01_D01_bin.156]
MKIDWSTLDWSSLLTYSGAIGTILGVIATILFGFLSFRIARQQSAIAQKQTELAEEQNRLAEQSRPRKQLLIYITSYLPLIRTQRDVVDKIKIEYEGSSVKNLASLQIKVENIGNQPILPSDYYMPLELSVSGLIIEARQIQQSDSNIVLIRDGSHVTDKIECERTLLNQSDSVTVILTVSEEEGISAKTSFSAAGRIVDGTIEYLDREPSQDYKNRYDVVNIPENKPYVSSSFLGFVNVVNQLLKVSIAKEDWPMVRDMLLIAVFFMIACAMLLDAIIPL